MPSSRKSAKPHGELALIAAIRHRALLQRTKATDRRLRLGIGDDCAILSPPRGHEILVTTDFSLENRHFRRDWHPPRSVGHRALARGLSDLAAMGAKPLAAFLSLAIPRETARNSHWLNSFLDGLFGLAKSHGVPLAGGDTSESPSTHILADIVLLGTAPKGRALRRSGARPGDIVYVTGSLGGSATELAALGRVPSTFRNARPADDHPHLYPQPRLAVGQALLRRRIATACIDLSDGISTDLAHLCEESHAAAEVYASKLPLHPLTQTLTPARAVHNALHGGEDYELLFTARPSTHMPRSIAGVRITPIGVITPVKKAAGQVTLVGASNIRSTLSALGWQHLR